MAASDDEGGQSDNKNEDSASQESSKQFSTIHQEMSQTTVPPHDWISTHSMEDSVDEAQLEGNPVFLKDEQLLIRSASFSYTAIEEIESQLERPGVSYEARVSAVLSGWERLAGFVHGDISQMQPLATYLYKWSLRLVLQGQWPGLAQIVKTRLGVTLQRCSNVSVLEPLCKTLLPLVSDPWGHKTQTILADGEITDEESVEYISDETWEVVRVRVDTMVESRCERLALRVLRVCVRCIHLQSEGMTVPLYTDEDHNHFVDLYFGLLHKFERKEFVEEVKKLDVGEGIKLVRRLVEKEDKLKVWKHRLKIADLAVQIILATTVVKKYSDDFKTVFCEWCNVQEALAIDDNILMETIHKYIQLSESSKHVYAMAGVLHEKCGQRLASLVTELLIRALTTDMNSLEALKLKTGDDGQKEDNLLLEHQMAKGFMDLGSVFTQHRNVARECILTAFSLHPTSVRLGLLGSYVNDATHSNASSPKVCRSSCFQEDMPKEMLITPSVCEESSDLVTASSNTPAEGSNDASNSRPSSAVPHPSLFMDSESSNHENANRTPDASEKDMPNLGNYENTPICDDSEAVFMAEQREANTVVEHHEVDSFQVVQEADQQSTSAFAPAGEGQDPPPKEQCTEDINIDTGQVQSSDSSQMCDMSGNSQMLTENLSLSLTKDSDLAKENVPVSVSEDSVHSDSKSKEDFDSLDKFYKSTENFIQQLRDEPPRKSPTQTAEDNYDILTQPNQVLDSLVLGLPKELCDDLAVVLSSPRWQVLSWKLEHHELLNICDQYLHDADSAKNLTKELKYLNIDYSQFKHLPSAEITEFTGIEKGYEHFVDCESESEYSEGEYHASNVKGNVRASGVDFNASEVKKQGKRKDGTKKVSHKSSFYESDSEYDSCGRMKDQSEYMAGYSDSDESDMCVRNKTVLLKMDHSGGGIIEGKRVTAVSSQDRSKRIRIDAGTGRIKHEKIDVDRGKVRHARNLMSTLRLFRHKSTREGTEEKNKFNFFNRSPGHYTPRLSSLNVNPQVVLTEREKSESDGLIQSGVTTVMAGVKRPAPTCSIPSSQSRGSWIYAGSLVAPPNSASSVQSPTPVSVSHSSSPSVQCYLRTKDGKVRISPLSRTLVNSARSQKQAGGENGEKQKSANTPTSGYLDSYAKFLVQNNKKSSITLVRKNMTLDDSLDYLEKQGTTVTYKSQKGGSAHALANAQKNVLNRIMSPENTIAAIRSRFHETLPVRAIAMPVSNNVPNLPADKSSPANLSRVLPKGTTVVRKPKTSSDGAGPSGVNNGGGVSPRAVITRPGAFSTVVAQPSTSVTNSSLRGGNSIMSVRTNATTIRTPVSRGVVVSGNSGVHEGAASNSTSTLVVSSSVVTSATAVGSVTTAMPAPLVSATVVGSVPTANNLSSPMGTLGGSNGQQPWENALDDSVSDSSPESSVALTQNMSSTRGATTCTTTVASPPGDVRAASMLETLLRDRPIPASPLHSPCTTATTTITAALPQTLTSVVGGTSIPITVSGEGQVTSAVMGAIPNTGNSGNSVVIGGGSSNSSGVIVASGVVGGATGSGVVVAGGGVVANTGVVATAGTSSLSGDSGSGAVQQVLVPGQLVQVHTSDGSTGLGIVHSSSLDLRLPAGTRVIKSSCGPARTTASQQHQVMGVINQTAGRQVNVLHNVKILQNVQNRQIVRTVVVPHSVALQGLSSHQNPHLKPQLVALSQGTNTSTSPTGASGDATTIVQSQGPAAAVRAKIPSSTIVQKVLGRGGLVIRTLRPQAPVNQASGETSAFEEGLGAKLQQQHPAEDDKNAGSTGTTVVARLPQDEGLGERLSHYLKTALVSSTSTQSVGTQTLTTAVKPSAGQCVNQVAMNHLRGSGTAVVSLTAGSQAVTGQSSNAAATSPAPPQQQAGLPSLPLTPTNAVSSETLEQLREFESVFEKVSNKSGKDTTDGETSTESYSSAAVSSEESMIAAQLLSMANDTPAVTTSSNYVYSVPASVYEGGSTRLTEGTYITIPSSTQAGTLILVNHSGCGTGLVTVAGGVQGQNPPTAPSPTLSSTSSHSSIASSPSSTSSKNKKQPPKPKVVPPTTPPAVAKPKSPPPPKTPAPKPTVAKPQVEESDETRARIQAILEQYKQELAINPQPQPAPRNRKNCPPPKGDGKSSSKKKSGVKKVEGSAGNSPAVSEGSIAGCPSPSPSPGPASDSSVGLSSNTSGVTSVQYSSQGLTSQGTGASAPAIITEEKIKTENSIKVEGAQEVVASAGPQLLQGVMVSNVKVEGATVAGSTSNLPQSLAGSRVVQLIRHGGKVTAITTRQPLNKIKTAGQSGPPPNVTIQGRINMNDLMESHIASLLTGGSPSITQSPTVVSKIIQQQATGGHPTVQQVVVQPSSSGPQVLQQVSVQQIPSTPPKAHQQQQKCGVIQQITSNEELLGLTTQPPRSLHVTLPTISTNVLSSTASVSNAATATNTQTIINSPVIINSGGGASAGPSPLSVPPSSPLTPQPIPVTSPNQAVTTSPQALSPTDEQPPTPSSFQMGEESNSSEQSVGDGSGPLPPFFTLKSFIMQQPQQQKHRSQNQQSQQQDPGVHDKSYSSVSVVEPIITATVTQAISSVISSTVSKSQRGGQSHIHLHHGHHQRKSASVIRTGVSSGRIVVGVTAEGMTKTLNQGGITASPLLSSGSVDAGNVSVSPMSGSSSLESSPAAVQSRIRLASRPQDMRSSSIDSLKSDLSVEEVQIPPSPATLTKQLQNAYMTEAALSPSVSQSHHSGSSYSSPGTTHDLPFSEAPPTSEDSFTATLTQPGCSSAPTAQGLSVAGVTLEGDTGLSALTSPSGDIYLHQSGSGLGLEGLEAATLPLVAGMEVRTHSPGLSDLVSSGPLLTWSPRSADSMMAQSPSLNDALTANIPLDGNHSEDSLCDSSTGFPGLFSIEGDGVSVSSSTSEDMANASLSTVSNNQQQQQERLETVAVTIDLTPQESEQDHTITSTRSPTQLELPVGNIRSVSDHVNNSGVSILGTPASQDTPWRFENAVASQNTLSSKEVSEDSKTLKKQEDSAGPSDAQFKASLSRSPQKKTKEQYGNIKTTPNQNVSKGKRPDLPKKQGKGTELKRNSTVSEGNKKRSNKLTGTTVLKGKKISLQNESGPLEYKVLAKNGHDEEADMPLVKEEDGGINATKNKRRSSQRMGMVYPGGVLQNAGCRNRSKSFKSEDIKNEEADVIETLIKEENPIKAEKESKDGCEDAMLRMKEGCEETLGRTTRGSKRRSEGEAILDLKRGRSARSSRRSDGDVLKSEEEIVNHIDEECSLSRVLRGRHISGASDTSSNYSVERALTPGPHDFLAGIGSSRRRRRLSRESSASSRDGSPTLLHTHDFSPGGVNTRRSSSRDHAKKKKCSCCVGGDPKKKGGPGGGGNSGSRRSSSRATRASHSSTVQ